MNNYEKRVQKYEAEGCTRSDAQAVVDAEDSRPQKPTKKYLTDELVEVDEVSKNKKGNFVFRRGFFYTHGFTSKAFTERVEKGLNKLGYRGYYKVVDAGEQWMPFRGGASLRTSSHWYVEVEFEKL